MAGYVDELAGPRAKLDRGSDDIESGQAQLMDGEETFTDIDDCPSLL